MKQFISLMLLSVVLASCGQAVAPTEGTPTTETEITAEADVVTDTTVDEVNSELEGLEYSELEEEAYDAVQDDIEVAVISEEEFEVVTVQAIYNNPAQEVFIDINYVLDDDDKISEIQVTNSNYDLTGQLGDLNVLVGKSLDEVEDTYISGGSLTVPAIKKALSAGA